MMTTEVLSYQFDDVSIDLRAGRVLKAGSPVSLEPKGYDLLVLLASRSGELVSKQEVLERIWSGVYVTDNAVARVVAQVRRGLGDTARGARYIETVPTRGYRFIVPVTRVMGSVPVSPATGAAGIADVVPPAGPLPSPPGGPGTGSPTADPHQSAHPVWAALLAVVALVAIVLAWRSQGPGPGRPTVQPAGTPTQVTSSAALDAFPAWAPDGHSLAYASDRGGRFEIFIRDLVAGGERVALTDDGQHNVQPAWSPDGTRIAYHSSGRGGIWVVARSGGAPTQLSPFGSRPVWSADGTRLAFQSAPYTEPGAAAFETFGPSSLWVIDAAGGVPRRVTEGWRPEGSHVRPTFFPDGRRLFFASQRLDTTSFWTVDLESGALTKVLEAGARAMDATLTPDGRSVFYVRMDRHFDLWKLPLTSTGTVARPPELVLPPGELDLRHVAVHPQGLRLAYVAMATVSGLRSLPLHRDGVPSGPSVRIAEDAVRTARRPSFSPDGRALVFERQSAGAHPQLWLLDLTQNAVRALTSGMRDARDPVWDDSGERVFFETGQNDTRALQAVHVADGREETIAPLADGGQPLLRPRVSPDGTRLAFTRSTEGQLEVWVRPLAGGPDVRVARLGDGVAFPVWAPDGKSLALDVWRDGHAQVHVVDLGTGAMTQVSRDVDQAWVRSWSPDGGRLAYAGAVDGRWNVWSVGSDGAAPRQLTTYRDEHHYVRNPEWSPMGDRLVYEFASFSGNVWMVDLR